MGFTVQERKEIAERGAEVQRSLQSLLDAVASDDASVITILKDIDYGSSAIVLLVEIATKASS